VGYESFLWKKVLRNKSMTKSMIAQNGEARRVIFDIVPQQKKFPAFAAGTIKALSPSTSAHLHSPPPIK
jgi:hypothetical protein